MSIEPLACAHCQGTGVVQGPGDSPCLEVGHYCMACETGQQFARRVADLVSRTLRLSRTGAAGH